jgi:hypothetical protein
MQREKRDEAAYNSRASSEETTQAAVQVPPLRPLGASLWLPLAPPAPPM